MTEDHVRPRALVLWLDGVFDQMIEGCERESGQIVRFFEENVGKEIRTNVLFALNAVKKYRFGIIKMA
jgi:hypothetical protein